MLSAIVITRNEEQMIAECLKSLQFCDELIVVDTGNTDTTNIISRSLKARIVKSKGSDYSQYRNDGLKASSGDWVLYVDADERVSAELAQEIKETVAASAGAVFALPRTNHYLGRDMKYGGWGDDYVIRLFRRQALRGWKNPLHEQPEFTGDLHKLKTRLIHISHRDLSSMLEKTIQFTDYESQLRMNAGHPKVVWWRILRMMGTEFWFRFVVKQAARDGTEGVIDGLFQVFNMFVIYARLWEKQHHKQGTGV